MQPRQTAADWRDAAAYSPLLEADRSILAWEWLRRDRHYAEAALCSINGSSYPEQIMPGAERWGLHGFEHPAAGAPEARPLWRAERHPAVLPVVAHGTAVAEDWLDIGAVTPKPLLLKGQLGQEHLLFSDGIRAIRLDVMAGTVARGPVRLQYLLEGFVSAERPLLTLRRLIALRSSGGFSKSLHRPDPQAGRRVLVLRAWDALAAGADQRDIAEALVDPIAGEPRWRLMAPSVRSRSQRLVRAAREMGNGGYTALL